MAEIPTHQQLYDAARNEVQSRNPALTDWTEGSNLDAVAGAAAMLADESIRVALARFAEGYFDTATDAALDRLALDRLGLTRKPATAAIGTVTWLKGVADAYTIPSGTRLQATVGDTVSVVQTTSDVAAPAGAASVELPCEATTTGRASNLAALGAADWDVLDTIVDDPDAVASNAQPFAGGSDEETDAAFRDRIRRYYGTLRRGTRDALVTGALTVPGVSFVTVDESEVEDAGLVHVYIGDPDARSNDTLAGLVATELESWRAAGVRVEVDGAEREEVALSIALELQAGADYDAVSAAVRAAVVGYGDSLGPNVRGRLSRIKRACHAASSLVLSARITSHDEDIEPTETHHAIRFVAETIALSITEDDE